MKTILIYVFSVLVPLLSGFFAPAKAQDVYPSGSIRLVLGFPPGATVDTVARLLSLKLGSQLNASVVVDNKPGANGNIAADFVAKSRSDGYTLMLNTSSVVFGPAFGEKLSYDILKDFAPISLVSTAPFFLVIHPSVPANNITEFIAYLKANPDKASYGSSGTGGISHLGPVMFLQGVGANALHVPYKGGAPAMIDLVGGRLQFRFADLTGIWPLVKDKRIKVIANAGRTRSPQLPDVPTISETVLPGFDVSTWNGVMAPAKTPPTVIKRLNAEITKALQDPEMKARFAQEGAEALPSTPEEFAAYLRNDLERLTKVIKNAGIKME